MTSLAVMAVTTVHKLYVDFIWSNVDKTCYFFNTNSAIDPPVFRTFSGYPKLKYYSIIARVLKGVAKKCGKQENRLLKMDDEQEELCQIINKYF